ncbi:MAG: LiaF transmembrane domain-containing protein [Clostridia bacterium]
MKFRNWFWGIFFILAAVFILLNQLGYFTQIHLFSLICTIILIPIILKSCYHLNFSGILFPLAILCIIYAEPLGITNLTPWPVLAIALFGSIGLSFIFGSHYHHSSCHHHEENFGEVIDSPDENMVNFDVHFGSSIKYVNTEHLQQANVHCSFGAAKVYFDHAQIAPEGAQIYLDISFSGVELYIPKSWHVVNKTNVTLGGIEEKNKMMQAEGPVVHLVGKVSFSGVEIIYI